MQYIDKYTSANQSEQLYVMKSDALDFGQLINFVDLSNLKEEIDRLFSDEQSRLLALELSGDYVCDGCTI